MMKRSETGDAELTPRLNTAREDALRVAVATARHRGVLSPMQQVVSDLLGEIDRLRAELSSHDGLAPKSVLAHLEQWERDPNPALGTETTMRDAIGLVREELADMFERRKVSQMVARLPTDTVPESEKKA